MIRWLRYMFTKPSSYRVTVGDLSFCPVSGCTDKGKLPYSRFLALSSEYTLLKLTQSMNESLERAELWKNSRLKRLLKMHLGDITIEQYEIFLKEASDDYKEFMI